MKLRIKWVDTTPSETVGTVIMIIAAVIAGMAMMSMFHYQNTIQLQDQILQQLKMLDTYRMHMERGSILTAFEQNKTLNGVAYPDGYFSVWVGRTNETQRNIIEVLDTCTHEYAHLRLDMGHNSDIRKLSERVKELES